MNSYIYGMALAMSEPAAHAWTVTRDYFGETCDDVSSAVGTTGPGEAPDALCEELRVRFGARVDPAPAAWNGTLSTPYRFTVWDDDGERMASGVLVTEHESPEDDESGANGALSAPLTDWAEGNYGCTRITWAGHDEWEIG